MNGYRINEDDIARVIRYLETSRPEKASREHAIQLLEIVHGAAKSLAANDADIVREIERSLGESDQAESKATRNQRDGESRDS